MEKISTDTSACRHIVEISPHEVAVAAVVVWGTTTSGILCAVNPWYNIVIAYLCARSCKEKQVNGLGAMF